MAPPDFCGMPLNRYAEVKSRPVVTVKRLAGAAASVGAGAAAADAGPPDWVAAAAVDVVCAHALVDISTAVATPIPIPTAALAHVVISLLNPVAPPGLA